MRRSQNFRIAIRQFGPFQKAIQRQWHSFQAITQSQLILDAVPFDLHPLSDALFENEGLLRGDWDIAFLSTDWVAAAHESASVVDLAPFLSADPPEDYPNGWTGSLLRLQTIENSVLGVPYHNGPECLLFRKDLFEDDGEQRAYQMRYGSQLAPPQTWDDFRQIAHFFHRPKDKLYGTVFAAFPDGHNTVYDFLLQLWTRGGELFDASRKINFNTPESIEALEFYRSMLQDTSATHPDCRQLDSVKSGLAFTSGEVAMMVNWFGFGAMAETIAQSRIKGRVGIAPIPHAKGGSSISLNAYWILSIAAGSRHREFAYQFLKHCLSASMDKLLTLEGAIGCRKSTWIDPEVNAVIPFYKELKSLHAVAREIPHHKQWAQVASRIDKLMLSVIQTQTPIPELVRDADLSF